ncbi:hypothetical protein ACM1RC_26745 [Paenibacillus azoreducens]|uniref:hypothetical protein n=1 Tax=Paenibacillus azoreducens TaxID=116718 RepID=UPI0039F554D4
MAAKPIKRCSFTIDNIKHFIRIQRTGDKMPQPARIVVDKEYWEDVGGWKGWETLAVYDKTFEDWDHAYSVYNEILNRADSGSIKQF